MEKTYRNVFREIGISEEALTKRLSEIVHTFFTMRTSACIIP